MLKVKCHACGSTLQNCSLEEYDLANLIQQLNGKCPKCHVKLSTTPKQILINAEPNKLNNNPKLKHENKWWKQKE